MPLSQEQFVKLRKQGLSIDQIKQFESGSSPNVTRATAGNQFDDPTANKAKWMPDIVAKGVNAIFGGGKLAEGLGNAIAAPGVQKDLSQGHQQLMDQQSKLLNLIKERKQSGVDTGNLEKALRLLEDDMKISADSQQDFVQALPTNKEVVGSSLRLATSAATPTLAKKFSALTDVKNSVGFLQGAWRGSLAGAGTGAISGGALGTGAALEANKGGVETALAGAAGAAGGAVTGGILGGLGGGLKGRFNANRSRQALVDYVTPEPSEIPKKQWEQLVKKGLVDPRSTFERPKYLLSENQMRATFENSDIITKDPTQTANNILKRVDGLDDEVGTFLKGNKSSFDKEALRAFITDKLDDVDDWSMSPDVVDARKKALVDKFVTGIDKDDVSSLWSYRKDFDTSRYMQNAWSGQSTFKKEVGIGLRNAVQEFIAQNSTDNTYSAKMSQMSRLYDLLDVVLQRSSAQRDSSALTNFVKQHDEVLRALGYGAAAVGGYIGLKGFVGKDPSSGG